MVSSRDILKLLDIPGFSRYPWFHQTKRVCNETAD